MKGGLGNLMKQAQAMQKNMQKAKEELAKMEVTGSAGGGLVTVIMTGKHDIKKVNIEDSVFSDDKDMLEDLLAAAVNDAVRNIEKQTEEKFSGMTEGLDLPGGFKMPF